MDEQTPQATPLDAIRRFWWLIVLTTLIGAGAGVAYGLARDPVYTAEAQLSVGRIDVHTQTIPGFAYAARSLAQTYARAVEARKVVAPVSKSTHVPVGDVLDHLSATPIPESAVIRVLGEDDNEASAMRFANSGGRALIAYVHHLNKHNPQSRELLERYRKATEAFIAAKSEAPANGPIPADVRADIAAARVKLRSAEALYGSSQAGQAAPNTLQLLTPATATTDDRNSFTQRAGFAGAVGGLLIGLALAMLIQARRPKRA
jgi:capsular polysaccharide biosynthesis protein